MASNEELLHVAGLYADRKDLTLSLAAILIFGSDELIKQTLPGYQLDCLLRRKNIDRYDDRLLLSTNLIDAYDLMMGFIEKHMNDPFYLEGDMSISIRERIFREAISNIIAHRDYLNATPARMLIYNDRVILDNPSVQYFHEPLSTQNLKSHPKNPTICKFMIQLGRFDQLGSGVINIHKYWPQYSNGATSVFEDKRDGFVLTLPFTVEETVEETVEIILKTMKSNPRVTLKDLETMTGLSRRGLEYHVSNLKKANKVQRIGSTKAGEWRVL